MNRNQGLGSRVVLCLARIACPAYAAYGVRVTPVILCHRMQCARHSIPSFISKFAGRPGLSARRSGGLVFPPFCGERVGQESSMDETESAIFFSRCDNALAEVRCGPHSSFSGVR